MNSTITVIYTMKVDNLKIKFIFAKKQTMNTLLFLGSIGFQEILVIALIVLLLFGGKKIPELMRGLGKGVKNFKDGMNGAETNSENQTKTNDENKQ